MAVTVNPSAFGPKPNFIDWITGAVANGYQVFFYLAGSVNTKQDTYTDSTGTVKNTNPLVLDTAGQPNNVQIWWPQGNSYKVLIATPTDSDPPTNGFVLGDNLRGINDGTANAVTSEWLVGPTPAFIGATSFALTGDQTNTFQVGRRIQTTNSGGTIYSRITASVFAASVTTITVVNDSGALDAGLSAVNYGILSATNQSIPVISSLRAGSATISGNATIGGTAAVTGTLSSGAFTGTSSAVWGTGVANFGTVAKRKTADQSVTSSTALVNDTHLSITVAANEEWIGTFEIDIICAAAGGFRVAATTPAGATGSFRMHYSAGATQNNGSVTDVAGTPMTVATTPGTFAEAHLSIWVLNGATPGTINLQFAQGTANVTATTFNKGSFMVATRVA